MITAAEMRVTQSRVRELNLPKALTESFTGEA